MNISTILIFIICVFYLVINIIFKNKILNENTFFLVFICIILFSIAIFRGDFTQDYKMYFSLFDWNYSKSFKSILSERDFLFWIITKIPIMFTGKILSAYIITAAIMMFFYYKFIKKESVDYLISIILFVAVDNYIISFNLMRNILAVSICTLAYKFIFEKKPVKFLLVIFIASMIHRSALIFVPMYWIFKINFKKRKNIIYICIGLTAIIIGLLLTREVGVIGQKLIGMNYTSYDNYGLDEGNIGSAVKTIVLLGIILLMHRKIKYEEVKERVLLNSCIVTCYFQILATKVLMFQRIGYYFSISYIILIPLIFSRIRSKKTKLFLKIGIVVAMLIYVQFIQHNVDYYFFWDNKLIKY